MMHIFHDWIMDMTHDEVIHTCRICGKEKREPWYPVMGWCRLPRMPKVNPINPGYIKLAQLAYDTVLQTMVEGEKEHDANGWKDINVEIHKDHAWKHAAGKFVDCDEFEDHLGHLLTRCTMIKYLEGK